MDRKNASAAKSGAKGARGTPPPGRLERNRARWGWFFVAPGILFFSMFSFYPMANAIWTSIFN